MADLFSRFRLAAFIALRLVRSRRTPTLSLVTVLSVVGVGVGVFALTVVLAVTGGFQQAFQERILGLYPHMVVHKRGTDFREYPELLERLADVPGVVGASPVTYDDMMIAAGMQRSGAVIKGLHLPTVESVIGVSDLLAEGVTLDSLAEDPTVTLDRAAGQVRFGDAVDGTWSTVVVRGGEAFALTDERTPPDPGNARMNVLDLRPAGDAVRLELVPASKAAGDPGEGAPAVDLGKTRRDRFTDAVEVPAGAWKLQPGDVPVTVDQNTLATLVLLPDAGTAAPLVLVAPSRIPLRDRTAMVRLVNASASGTAPLTLQTEHDSPAPVAAGSAGAYVEVPARLPGILLGAELAHRLNAEIGTEVTLVTPLRGVDNKMLGPFGMAPSSQRHVVTGTFSSGFYEYDVRLALVNMVAAQRFLNSGPVIRWIEVKTDDLLDIDSAKRRVAAALDPYDMETVVHNANALGDKLRRIIEGDVSGIDLKPSSGFVDSLRNATRVVNVLKYQEYDLGYQPRYRIIDWEEMNTNLFSALMFQKVALTMFFLIIVVVGSFVVVGSQMMVISDKAADIAILKAMGADGGLIRMVFTLQGAFVAALGALAGLGLGLAGAGLVHVVDYELESAVYLIDRLPVKVVPLELLLVAAGALVCTIVATQYSAGKAASKTPVEGLRAVE